MIPEMPEDGATFRIDTLGAFFRRTSKHCKYTNSYPFLTTTGRARFKTRLRFSCDKQGVLCVKLSVSLCDTGCSMTSDTSRANAFEAACGANCDDKVTVTFNSFGQLLNTSTGEYIHLWNLQTPATTMTSGSTVDFPIDLKLNVSSCDRFTQVTIDRLRTTGFVRHDQLLLKWKID
ncbi:hypothetical protein Bpfe_017249, partial [Biomphalaria pfeifferi]